jgi:murein DD-endopeptidase MepM/ murein hydrolase activator NlpD
MIGGGAPGGPGAPRDLDQASRALEATLLRQLLASSGAFKGANVPGGEMNAQLFVEALADAVAKGGGMGLARLIQGSIDPDGALDPDSKLGPGEAPAPIMPPAPRTPLAAPAPVPSASTLAPPGGLVVTSGFGPRVHPIDGTSRFHTGVDLRAAEGEPIRAAAGGVVLSAGPRGGYGNAVEIDHGGGRTTLYAHASSLSVRPGDRVEPGQEVGKVGQTGRATGPHLHFELRQHGKPLNPGLNPTRALNAYGDRAEAPVGTKPASGL